jgi:hypothetical protein
MSAVARVSERQFLMAKAAEMGLRDLFDITHSTRVVRKELIRLGACAEDLIFEPTGAQESTDTGSSKRRAPKRKAPQPSQQASAAAGAGLIPEESVEERVARIVKRVMQEERSAQGDTQRTAASNPQHNDTDVQVVEDQQEVIANTPVTIPNTGKNHLSATNNKSYAMAFNVNQKVRLEVLKGEYVPLFKLLPGYRSTAAGLLVAVDKHYHAVGADDREDKLGRKSLSLNMTLLALLKYKDIVQDLYPLRAAAISSHMMNIIDISIKYSNDTYYLYHDYVWNSHFEGGCVDQVWESKWLAVDQQALAAATTHAHTYPNSCSRCQSGRWSHATEACPFSLDEQSPHAHHIHHHNNPTHQKINLSNTQSLATPPVRPRPGGVPNPSSAGGKKTITCTFYNSANGCIKQDCKFPHICAYCQSSSHSVDACSGAPRHMKNL